jgi:hypothetical protein
MPPLLKFAKPTGDAERATQTTMDTKELTPQWVAALKQPPFQRDLKVNQKVLGLLEDVRKSAVLPGIITLGVLDGVVYVVDGQHRLWCYLQTELPIAYADVRTHYFETMGQMAAEYVRLNQQLVRLRPDDILKGLEQSNICLQRIRKRCGYIGYTTVRRGSNGPVLSMSQALKVWYGTRGDVPVLPPSAIYVAEQLEEADVDEMTEFLGTCFEAWHRDIQNARLWSSLNLLLVGWLWRHVVIGAATKGSGKGQTRSDRLTREQFKRGMLSLSANQDYLEWLVGRQARDMDRTPAYNRIKAILAARYVQDTKFKVKLPSPAWAK